jgi:hypothetical protein
MRFDSPASELEYNHALIMQQMANVLATEPESFVDLLEANDIPTDNMEDTKLIDVYIENLPDDDSLKACTAYLLNEKINGEKKVDNKQVKSIFDVIYDFWNEPQSNIGGTGVVKNVADLGGKIADIQAQKKFGASTLLSKQNEARAEMLKTLQTQKQAQLDAQKLAVEQQKSQSETKSKRINTIIIASSIVVGLGIIGTLIYFLKRK